LTATENLTFAAKALGRPRHEIGRVLERVGLSSRMNTPAKRLSAGQRRRLGLAWLLLRRPETWLLDEPYATLDDEGRNFFDELIGDVVKSGASVIVSAHDPLRSHTLSPRTITLAGGLVVEDSS
jgi:heme exporter protein A